jgi:hypothetical protein
MLALSLLLHSIYIMIKLVCLIQLTVVQVYLHGIWIYGMMLEFKILFLVQGAHNTTKIGCLNDL